MRNAQTILMVVFYCFIFLENKAYSDILSYKRGIYAKISSGLVIYEDMKSKCDTCVYEDTDMDASVPISISLGYNFNKNIAAEILGRFSTLKYEFDDGHAHHQRAKFYTFFLNIYYKHLTINNLTPYMMFGPGYTFNISGTQSAIEPSGNFPGNAFLPGRDINSLVWNIGLGCIISKKNNFSLDLGYRYMYLGKIGVKSDGFLGRQAETRPIKAHEFVVGLIYKF